MTLLSSLGNILDCKSLFPLSSAGSSSSPLSSSLKSYENSGISDCQGSEKEASLCLKHWHLVLGDLGFFELLGLQESEGKEEEGERFAFAAPLAPLFILSLRGGTRAPAGLGPSCGRPVQHTCCSPHWLGQKQLRTKGLACHCGGVGGRPRAKPPSGYALSYGSWRALGHSPYCPCSISVGPSSVQAALGLEAGDAC